MDVNGTGLIVKGIPVEEEDTFKLFRVESLVFNVVFFPFKDQFVLSFLLAAQFSRSISDDSQDRLGVNDVILEDDVSSIESPSKFIGPDFIFDDI